MASDDPCPDTHGAFKPILDRILVRRLPVDEPADGFTVPEKHRQSSNWAEVVAVGDGVMLGHDFVDIHDFVKVGDWVKFGEFTAEAFDVNDPDSFIVRIQDVREYADVPKSVLDISAFTEKLIAFANAHGFEIRTTPEGVTLWPTYGPNGSLDTWFSLFIRVRNDHV